MNRRRCKHCGSFRVTRSRRRCMFETLKCYWRRYGFVSARLASPGTKRAPRLLGLIWISQHAHLVLLFLCVPLVVAGPRVHPRDQAKQPSSGSEARNEPRNAEKPVPQTALPAVLRQQNRLGEVPDAPKPKNVIETTESRGKSGSVSRVPDTQETRRRPLGVFKVKGEVYVNNSPAPSESTIFAGDTVRTGENGFATFASSGEGSLVINSNTEISFPDDARYIAELHQGTVVLHILAGSTRFQLRVLSVTVNAPVRTEATAEVHRAAQGFARVTCKVASVVVYGLEDQSLFGLKPKESVTISLSGQVEFAPSAPIAPPAASAKAGGDHRTAWIVLGVAGAGGAGIAAAVAGRGGHRTVSPSSP